MTSSKLLRIAIARRPVALVVFAMCACLPLVAVADREVANQVREGLRLHQAGQFAEAAEAFAKAAQDRPEDPRLAFNHGTALAAQGKHDEAEARLRAAALARDPELAAAAHYNLGCLAADQLKRHFGEAPEEAVEPAREEGLLLVRTAVDHYRQALRTDPAHRGARRNLELLRIWSKHIQDRWAERDRERRRDAMSVLEYLQWLKDEQRGVRAAVRVLPPALNTPSLRQAARRLSTAQHELVREIEPLKQKLEQVLQPPPDASAANPPGGPNSAPSPASPPAAEMQQVRQVLQGLADESGNAMRTAAEQLGDRHLPAALAAQTDVLPPLNQLFELLAPFEAILETAIASQTELVNAARLASSDETNGADPADEPLPGEDAREEQQFVSGWAGMLIRKATQLLAEARSEAGDAAVEPGGPTEIPLPTSEEDPGGATSSAGQDSPAAEEADEASPSEIGRNATDPGAADDPAAVAEPKVPPVTAQAAYEKAVELGPRIKMLTGAAADDLQQEDWAAALPKQEEALELLKEIAALLPRDDQQQDQQNQDQQDRQQDQGQDQQQQDQQQTSDDQQGKQDKQGDPSSDQQQKQDGESEQEPRQPQEEDQQPGQQASDEEPSKQKEPDREAGRPAESARQLSREEAESLLRQVRERERQHREFEQELRRLIRSRIIVERDW